MRSKAPLAVAGILAVPLFFVALLALSLRIDEPSQTVKAAGKVVYGDPTKGTLATIYLLALAVALAVVLIGAVASSLRSRLAIVAPAAVSMLATVLLLIPLDSWAAGHTQRYPLGVDNIADGTPQHPNPQNLFLQGEWEHNAVTTAREIGFVTIGLAIAAIALAIVFEIRRRRGQTGPVVPPPPVELDTGGAPLTTG